jgi:Beta-fructosidases (levanase/invertase)
MDMVRPIFHLRTKENWINDPNGPVFIKGQFHMFMQHNPKAPVWGNMTWAHAVSPDMVNWQRLPHAMYPDKPYDKDGVFSGCCVMHNGIPHILYTGVYPETLCLAIGDEDGMNFTKYEHNPILTRGDRDLKHGWRDPYIWTEDGKYRMIIGSGAGGEGNAFAEIYEGTDLLNWSEPVKVTDASEYSLTDTMWECPIVVRNGEDAVLIVSSPFPKGKFLLRAISGKLRNGKLENGVLGLADLGDSAYAPNLVQHPDGRWILFAWEIEGGDPEKRAVQGWQGMLTLPREVAVENGSLVVRPAKEVDSLREKNLFHEENMNDADVTVESGQHYEADIKLSPNGGTAVLELLKESEGNGVQVVFDGENIDVIHGKYAGGEEKKLSGKVVPEKECHLRIFVDGTSIEIYINDREVLTTRAYPNPDCTRFGIKTTENCKINLLDLYAVKNCYSSEI